MSKITIRIQKLILQNNGLIPRMSDEELYRAVQTTYGEWMGEFGETIDRANYEQHDLAYRKRMGWPINWGDYAYFQESE